MPKEKKFLYGNRADALGRAIEKQVPLRINMQLDHEQCKTLREFMNLYEVDEPLAALRIAVEMGVATGSKFSIIQRMKMRVITNEIRSHLIQKAAHAYGSLVDEMKTMGMVVQNELAMAQAEYNAVNPDDSEDLT